ncbi:hypothetical protein [Lysobacter gummosus]|uniref:hypothetical protein n=1 Tax=Lysobacter gummosus TaxID=262324 RepID=UPI003643564D
MRQRLSGVYASATRAGSREFQASSARRTFCVADSSVNGGSGGRLMIVVVSLEGESPTARRAPSVRLRLKPPGARRSPENRFRFARLH